MNTLNFSDNLIRLRRKKGITQEELANFIGITKASVSKWENRQSLPDILLLPQLAAFFDVTVDELLGYEAQLSYEQIQKFYTDLSVAFEKEDFIDVLKRIRSLIHRYYSCYPFLLQMCVLYLNHFMLAPDQATSLGILTEASDLCERITKNCPDMGICSDAVSVKAIIDLQLGKPQDVIETLETLDSPFRISGQNDGVLIQAYQMAGETEKAKDHTQITMYLHLLPLVAASTMYLSLHMNNLPVCKETIQRTEGIIQLYHLDTLHPNSTAQFYYQSALVYAANGNPETALLKLKQYGTTVRYLLTGDNMRLHGDNYFDRLDKWINKLILGAEPPRAKNLVLESVAQSLMHPLFTEIQDTKTFQQIKQQLLKGDL